MATLHEQFEELEKERDALKSQVNAFKDGINYFNRSGGDMNPLLNAYLDTPEQCLNSVKADAIAEATNHAYAAGYKRPIEFLHDYVNKLRNSDS